MFHKGWAITCSVLCGKHDSQTGMKPALTMDALCHQEQDKSSSVPFDGKLKNIFKRLRVFSVLTKLLQSRRMC